MSELPENGALLAKNLQKLAFIVLLPVLAVQCGACAGSTPIDKALGRGFDIRQVQGRNFRHMVLTRASQVDNPATHIYIEGDGIPWDMGRIPARDPTPRNALALELAAQDPNDVIYVGRPCYFGHARDRGCSTAVWTSARYGPDVVDSMTEVVENMLSGHPNRPLVLIGHSGGGVLARLMADQLSQITSVLTVAANLDIDAWTSHHRYEPLTESVNPANFTYKRSNLFHIQLLGTVDEVVPLTVTQSYLSQHPETLVWTYDGFDHACCWRDEWRNILTRFQAEMTPN